MRNGLTIIQMEKNNQKSDIKSENSATTYFSAKVR